MKRGEIWTAAGGADYAGKPRPVVVVQDSGFGDLASITICPLTSDPTEAPLLRLAVAPSSANGLKAVSRIMVDKVTTVPRSKLGRRIGRLAEADLRRLSRAIIVFLGLAD